MPPKKNPETQAEQSARFKKDARKLIKGGDLDPAVADAVLDKLMRQSRSSADQASVGLLPSLQVMSFRASKILEPSEFIALSHLAISCSSSRTNTLIGTRLSSSLPKGKIGLPSISDGRFTAFTRSLTQ